MRRRVLPAGATHLVDHCLVRARRQSSPPDGIQVYVRRDSLPQRTPSKSSHQPRNCAARTVSSRTDPFSAVITGQPLGPEEPAGVPRHFVESHFGNGVLTFNPLVKLRNAPGYNVWITGPSNEFKDGISAMSALIETDWMPFTFSVSWKFTRPGHRVRFDQGEPICFFFPVPRDVVGQCQPSLKSIGDDPALARSYVATRYQRNLAVVSSTDDDTRFQGWYLKGRDPGGSSDPIEGHQTSVGAKPFAR